ncbi:signal recognition particle-docking protein FtsY [Tyzzerella sp. OttesenSCG-928-J15]|nr:signal recognition particle-docking protein FtsY [Tyzzerella sp. OttesenSCG-928-J15]
MSIFRNLFSGKDKNKKETEQKEENIEIIEDNEDIVESSIETEESFEEVADKEDANEESIEDVESDDAAEEEKPSEPKGLFAKFFSGLEKTRKNIMDSVESVLSSFTSIDEDMFDELEEALIMADIGVETSTAIIDAVKGRVKREKVTEASGVKALIVDEIATILKSENTFELSTPSVILVIGVNGVGKTTTIGKLASKYKAQGKSVALAAADTFRAAAIDQLEIWANRNDVPIIKHQENSDPAAVVYDGIQAAKARNFDVLICDTAGRLHNKKNLMDELRKINKIIEKEYSKAQKEVFLVLDATTGQNALQQAKLFKETADITGIILTKLDGTAKGGIIIAIKNELEIPVRYIGIGEKVTDLEEFDAEVFSKALFGE